MFNSFMTEVPIIQKPVRRANQWTGFYMIGITVMKELRGIISFCPIKNFTFNLTFRILAVELNILRSGSHLPKKCFIFQ